MPVRECEARDHVNVKGRRQREVPGGMVAGDL